MHIICYRSYFFIVEVNYESVTRASFDDSIFSFSPKIIIKHVNPVRRIIDESGCHFFDFVKLIIRAMHSFTISCNGTLFIEFEDKAHELFYRHVI